jgi:hypothetical protein
MFVFLVISNLVGLLVCLGVEFGNIVRHAQISANRKQCTVGKMSTNRKYTYSSRLN